MREAGIKCLLGAAFDDDPYLSSSEAAFSCDAEAALDGLRLAARAAGAEMVRLVCTGETGRRKLKEQSAELLLEPGPKYPRGRCCGGSGILCGGAGWDPGLYCAFPCGARRAPTDGHRHIRMR